MAYRIACTFSFIGGLSIIVGILIWLLSYPGTHDEYGKFVVLGCLLVYAACSAIVHAIERRYLNGEEIHKRWVKKT